MADIFLVVIGIAVSAAAAVVAVGMSAKYSGPSRPFPRGCKY